MRVDLSKKNDDLGRPRLTRPLCSAIFIALFIGAEFLPDAYKVNIDL
jgi:hypothetical protein